MYVSSLIADVSTPADLERSDLKSALNVDVYAASLKLKMSREEKLTVPESCTEEAVGAPVGAYVKPAMVGVAVGALVGDTDVGEAVGAVVVGEAVVGEAVAVTNQCINPTRSKYCT